MLKVICPRCRRTPAPLIYVRLGSPSEHKHLIYAVGLQLISLTWLIYGQLVGHLRQYLWFLPQHK